MGSRVRNVMSELNGEKIDIVDWSDDPAQLVAHALSPAQVTSVEVVDAEAKAVLDKSYAWLNRWMDGREWAANDRFGIADCAAAPALFYAHWGHPIPQPLAALRDYRARLLARPSIARVVDEARPWRENFPLKGRGSPD